jgi:hypothetical protein
VTSWIVPRSRRRLLASVLALLLVLSNAAPATAATFVFPVDRLDESPCTSELVAVTGTVHVNLDTNSPGSGDYRESTTESVKGTGVLSGARYVGHTNTMSSYHVGPGSTYTHVLTTHLIRQAETAPKDDYFVHTVMHITSDAAGVPSVSIESPTLTCK